MSTKRRLVHKHWSPIDVVAFSAEVMKTLTQVDDPSFLSPADFTSAFHKVVGKPSRNSSAHYSRAAARTLWDQCEDVFRSMPSAERPKRKKLQWATFRAFTSEKSGGHKLREFSSGIKSGWRSQNFGRSGRPVLHGFLDNDGLVCGEWAHMSGCMQSRLQTLYANPLAAARFKDKLACLKTTVWASFQSAVLGLQTVFSAEACARKVAKMSVGKAADSTGLTSELLKAMLSTDGFWPLLAAFFVSISLLHRDVLAEWLHIPLCLLPKVRRPTAPNDLRLVVLANILEKLYRRVLYKASLPLLPLLHFNVGGRPGHQCADLSLSLRLVASRAASHKVVFIAKVDFQAAFDSVCQEDVLDCLLASSVPVAWIYAFLRSTTHTELFISRPDLECEIVQSQGIRQGMPDSSWLFTAVWDHLVRPLFAKCDAKSFGFLVGDKHFHHAVFCDDTLLVSPLASQLASMVSDFSSHFAPHNLGVHKGKLLAISSLQCDPVIVSIDGSDVSLPFASSMPIWGCNFSLRGDFSSLALEHRVKAAQAPFHSNIRMLCARLVPLASLIRFLARTTALSLTWSAEIWCLQPQVLKRLDFVFISLVIKMLGSIRNASQPWLDWWLGTFRAARVHIQLAEAPWPSQIVLRRYWYWCGHVARLPSEHLLAHVFLHCNSQALAFSNARCGLPTSPIVVWELLVHCFVDSYFGGYVLWFRMALDRVSWDQCSDQFVKFILEMWQPHAWKASRVSFASDGSEFELLLDQNMSTSDPYTLLSIPLNIVDMQTRIRDLALSRLPSVDDATLLQRIG